MLLEKFDDKKLYENFCNMVYGEEVDVEMWFQELEGSLNEQE